MFSKRIFLLPFCFPFDKVYSKMLCSRKLIALYELGFLRSQLYFRLASRNTPFPLCSSEHSGKRCAASENQKNAREKPHTGACTAQYVPAMPVFSSSVSYFANEILGKGTVQWKATALWNPAEARLGFVCLCAYPTPLTGTP